MTVVKEPVKVYTNVPKPELAPRILPVRQPVEAPAEERELVPVRRQAPEKQERL